MSLDLNYRCYGNNHIIECSLIADYWMKKLVMFFIVHDTLILFCDFRKKDVGNMEIDQLLQGYHFILLPEQ